MLHCLGPPPDQVNPPLTPPPRLLEGFVGCNATEKTMIQDAFTDAVRLGQLVHQKYAAMNASQMDNDLPLLEYFGPARWNSNVRKEVLGILGFSFYSTFPPANYDQGELRQ